MLQAKCIKTRSLFSFSKFAKSLSSQIRKFKREKKKFEQENETHTYITKPHSNLFQRHSMEEEKNHPI